MYLDVIHGLPVTDAHAAFVFCLQTAAEGSNLYGMDNSNYPVLETYDEGGVFEVKIVLSTWHWVSDSSPPWRLL